MEDEQVVVEEHAEIINQILQLDLYSHTTLGKELFYGHLPYVPALLNQSCELSTYDARQL